MTNKPKTVIFRVQEELYKDFLDKCERNYKSVSEVLRDFMLQYIEGGKKCQVEKE